jgi:hypothetical protein
MNSLALMNWMEVKIDQIRSKLNSLHIFPLTTWLTSVAWVQMELSSMPVKSDGTTIPTMILHCQCFPLHGAQLVSHALHLSLLTPTMLSCANARLAGQWSQVRALRRKVKETRIMG